MTTTTNTDPIAAAIYRREAEKDYEAAERSRKLGHPISERIARDLARRHDSIAELLEGRRR